MKDAVVVQPRPQLAPFLEQRFVDHFDSLLSAGVLIGDDQPGVGQPVHKRPVILANF